MASADATFRLSPSYGIHDAREAHDWFLEIVREHEGSGSVRTAAMDGLGRHRDVSSGSDHASGNQAFS